MIWTLPFDRAIVLQEDWKTIPDDVGARFFIKPK